jgi:hypothetical protein
MPFISDQQIAKLQSIHASAVNKAQSAKAKAIEKAEEIKTVAEVVGAAGIMGFARGKLEAPDGSFNVPGTNVDVELAVGLALTGAGMLEALGKSSMNEDILNAGSGVLAHYVGQIARKWGKTGTFSPIAGL